jgi:hypothetical protein
MMGSFAMMEAFAGLRLFHNMAKPGKTILRKKGIRASIPISILCQEH